MFTDNELNMIYRDQQNVLKNFHIGPPCANLSKCHVNHFLLTRIEPFEIEERQSIMTKILDAANACGCCQRMW